MKLYNPKFKKTFYSEINYKKQNKELIIESKNYDLNKSIERAREKLRQGNVFLITIGQHLANLDKVEDLQMRYSQLYQGDSKLDLHLFLILYECVYDQSRDLNSFQSFISKEKLTIFINSVKENGDEKLFLHEHNFIKQTKCKIIFRLDHRFKGELVEGLIDIDRVFYVNVKKEYINVVENFLNDPNCYKLWNIFSHHVLSTDCSEMVDSKVRTYYENLRLQLEEDKKDPDGVTSGRVYRVLELKDYFIENIHKSFLIEDLRGKFGNDLNTSIFNNYIRTKIPNPTEFYIEAKNHIKLDNCDLEKALIAINQIEESLKIMNITASSKLRFGQITFAFLTFKVIQEINRLSEDFKTQFPNEPMTVTTSYSLSDPTVDGDTGIVCEIKIFSKINEDNYVKGSVEEKDKFDSKSLSFKISDSIGCRNRFKVMDGNVKARCVHCFYGTMEKMDKFTLFALNQQLNIANGENPEFENYGYYRRKLDTRLNTRFLKKKLISMVGKDKKLLVTIWEREQIRDKDGNVIIEDSKFEDENQLVENEQTKDIVKDTMEDTDDVDIDVNQNLIFSSKSKSNIETNEAFFLTTSYTLHAYNPFNVKKMWVDGRWVDRKFNNQDNIFDEKGKFFRRMKLEDGYLVAVPRIVTIDLISEENGLPYLCKVYLSLDWNYRTNFVWESDGDFKHLYFKFDDLKFKMSQIDPDESGYMLITCGGEFVGYRSGNVLIKCEEEAKDGQVREIDRTGFGYTKDNGYASTGCLHQDVRGICSSVTMELSKFGRAFKSKLRLTGPFKRAFLNKNKPDYCDSKILYQDSIIQIMNRTDDPSKAIGTTYFTPKDCIEVKTIKSERFVLFHLYFPYNGEEKIRKIIEEIVPECDRIKSNIEKLEDKIEELESILMKEDLTKNARKNLNNKKRKKENKIIELNNEIKNLGYKEAYDNFYFQDVHFTTVKEEGEEEETIDKTFIVYDHFFKIPKTIEDVYMLHHEAIQSLFPLFGGEGEIILPRSNPRDGMLLIKGKERIIEVKTSPSLYRAGIQAYDAKYYDSEKLMAAYNGIATTKNLNEFLLTEFFETKLKKMDILCALNACLIHLRLTNDLIKEFSREKLSFMLDVVGSVGEQKPIPYKEWNPNKGYKLSDEKIQDENKKLIRTMMRSNLFSRNYKMKREIKSKMERNVYKDLLEEFRFNLNSRYDLKFDENLIDEDLKETFHEFEEELRENWSNYKDNYPLVDDDDFMNGGFNFKIAAYTEMYGTFKHLDPEMMNPKQLSEKCLSNFASNNKNYIDDLMQDDFDCDDEELECSGALQDCNDGEQNVFKCNFTLDNSLAYKMKWFMEYQP